MSLTRRGFLKAMIGAAAGTAVGIAMPSAVEAAVLGNKYARLITAQGDVIVNNNLLQQAEGPARKAALKTMINTKVDDLLVLLNTEFNGREDLENKRDEMYRKVSQIFNGELVVDTMSEAELRRLENPIIAVAVMRYLLARQRVIFNPAGMTGWDSFSDLYQDVILRA